jgi:hypothetical protein
VTGEPTNDLIGYHEACDMGDDGGPCEHCLEMRRLRARVTELEEALREAYTALERMQADAHDREWVRDLMHRLRALAAAGEGDATEGSQ